MDLDPDDDLDWLSFTPGCLSVARDGEEVPVLLDHHGNPLIITKKVGFRRGP